MAVESNKMDKQNEEAPDSGRLTESRPHQENLMTQVVSFDQKSYFLDVRENERGKYLKLTESSQRRRSTILLSGFALKSLQTVIDDAIKGNYTKEKEGVELDDHWLTVFSKRVQSRNKKIYIDLMQNKRGMSINIAEVSENRPKTAVVVSERGWLQFKRALEEIYDKFPELNDNQPFTKKHNQSQSQSITDNINQKSKRNDEENRPKSTVLASRKLSQQNKNLFFDYLENDLGRYLKISELKRNKRETLFLPNVCFEIFAKILENLQHNDLESAIEGVEKLDLPENDTDEHKTLCRKVVILEEEDEEVRKYHFDLRENSHGKFLRLTEVRPHKSNCVFFPFETFGEIKQMMEEFNKIE